MRLIFRKLPESALRTFRELRANDPCGRSAPSSRALPAHYPRVPRTPRVCVANFPANSVQMTLADVPRSPCALSENPANFPRLRCELSANSPRTLFKLSVNFLGVGTVPSKLSFYRWTKFLASGRQIPLLCSKKALYAPNSKF